nr:telomere repeat-binding protein 5-like isoform X1 [Ipomoea batatas]
MVFQKRLDYGFDGYQVPPIPRSTRSSRKRGSNWRKADVNHVCAFDLLATVAGNLLLEGENSPQSANTSSASAREHSAFMKYCIKEEKQNEEQTMQEKPCDQGSSERGFFLSELVSQAPMLSNCSSELLLAQNDTLSAPASVITSSDCSEKFATMEHLVNGGNKLELGSLNRKADQDVSGCKVFSNRKLGFEFGKPGSKGLVNDNKAGICISGFPVLGNRKPSTLVCSDDSVKLTPPKDHISCVSFPVKRDDVKLGSRDDDENSSGCTQPSTASKVFRQAQPYIEDRKSGKLSAPKYLEVNPKSNDEEHLNADVETRHAFDNSKNSFKHQRSLKDYPFKKRKLYDCSSVSISDVGIRNDGICSRYNGDASSYTLTLPSAHPVAGTSSSAAGESASFRSGDSQVKLRIKSFRIPELFIEIPETATVGSLKRTVMEAVTTILGGGLRVGVLFQGKKVRDDSKTLLQTGICHDNKLNAVGFTLEPNPSQDPPPPMCPKEHPYLLSRDSPQPQPQPISRYPSSPSVVHNAVQRGPNSALPNHPRGTSVINFFESDHDSAPSPPDILLNKSAAADSRALVAVPSGNAEALSMAPAARKPKRSETAQRRIRRPFSVSEVEALVQAVEKLGTGR